MNTNDFARYLRRDYVDAISYTYRTTSDDFWDEDLTWENRRVYHTGKWNLDDDWVFEGFKTKNDLTFVSVRNSREEHNSLPESYPTGDIDMLLGAEDG